MSSSKAAEKSVDNKAEQSSGTDSGAQSENEYQAKRSRKGEKDNIKLTDDEYVMVAKDIMAKPPFSGYLKYHLPLRYAARCEEVRWTWNDQQTGKTVFKELIGGGRNSDLEYD